MMKIGMIHMLTAVLLLFVAETASAHRVIIFAYVEGDTVYTESKFAGGKKVNAGTVEVYDPSDKKLLEGITDDQGSFSFKVPRQSDLKIVILAGMGHRGEWTVTKAEIDEASGTQTGSDSEISRTEKHLDGLTRQDPKIKDVLAGISCIIALVCIIYFFNRNRKKKQDKK